MYNCCHSPNLILCRKLVTNMVDIQEKAELHAEELLQLLQAEETADFRDLFLELHPYEQAMFYREQEKDNRMRVYHFLSPKEMAEIMEYIELEETEKFITEMDPQFATMVIAELAADDAVDILKELTKDEVASFLAIMEKQPAEEIKALLHYEEKTAGSIMTTEYIAFIKTQTVKETMKEMKVKAPDAETSYYTYVLDESKRLAGVVSLRDLIVADENELLENVMNENVLAVPVVDFQNHLLGIITVDDILDVMDEEASDDYSKFAAVVDIDTKDSSPTQAAKMRLPWLIILLFLGMVTASLIDSFEETLEAVPVVAIFIPLIAGMAGNAGTQSLAVAVRGLAVGTYGKDNKLKLLLRE